MYRRDIPAPRRRVLVWAAAALALVPAATSQARAVAAGRSSAPVALARAAELVPRLALASATVQVTARYGIGFLPARCNEPERDFCSLAARLYFPPGAIASHQVRIGVAAGTAGGAGSGRLGFIMNVPGWRLLRGRHQLSVTLRGTIVHGGDLTGRVDRTLSLVLVP